MTQAYESHDINDSRSSEDRGLIERDVEQLRDLIAEADGVRAENYGSTVSGLVELQVSDWPNAEDSVVEDLMKQVAERPDESVDLCLDGNVVGS